MYLFKQAITQEPSEDAYYCNLGQAYCAQGYYEEAIESFTQALQLGGSSFYSYRGMGLAYNGLEEYEKAIQTKSIILFTASWCPDCMFIKPFIGNVVKKYPNFTFYSINRDYFIDLCQDLDILGIPSFVSYENGQETGRFVSKLRKTQEEIETFIQSIK